eukprot:4610494-Prymnesium_polylepis.1
MLKACDDEVKLMLYEALMADLRDERVSEHWRRILYVLLVKSLPNNPELVNQRREIGLGPQDLKLSTNGTARCVHAAGWA